MKRKILTYSMISYFLSCRKRYEYRYKQQLVPVETPTALSFGSAIHSALEFWFKYGYAEHYLTSELSHEDELKVEACIEAYINHYGEENWKVLAVESKFTCPLTNPKTGRFSRIWEVQGRIDGLVETDEGVFILEHKTTSNITDEYLAKIAFDSQLALYALHYPSEKPIVGAIYDIIEKPSIRMKKGETDEEFEARKAELLAKSKTGKTTAKQQVAETDEEFLERLRGAITEKNFKRVVVKFDEEFLNQANAEIWEVARDIHHSQNNYKNTSQCNVYGGCPYLTLCMANGDIRCCYGQYKLARAHLELNPENGGE